MQRTEGSVRFQVPWYYTSPNLCISPYNGASTYIPQENSHSEMSGFFQQFTTDNVEYETNIQGRTENSIQRCVNVRMARAFSNLNCVSFLAGLAGFEELLRGKGVIMVLVLLSAVALAPWYMHYQVPSCEPHSEKKPTLPDIPKAFTGRSDEIQRLIRYVVTEHIGIISVTGGPGYGKSSVAIISSHELMKLGITVYYVSLSEVNSIEAFVMAFMHATARRKKTEQMPEKEEFFSWVESLDAKTIVILDNADLLTLNETDLRNNFLKLLKDAVTKSSYMHFVVATRYRFKYANDFAEIHLSPLSSVDSLTLLRCVILPSKQTSNKRDGSLEDDHLKGIANRTGGIPLALKVVGELVKSGIVSTAEVLDELAADPLHALSRESFPPDEQLKRCFSLSYKYLSQIMRKCLIYASRFPGTFDRRAKDAIITSMTGDAHCLDQLVDRSLVEYSAVEERYTVHSLLRTFVANSVTEQPPKHKYYQLFCHHFILLLSRHITKARVGDVEHLYTTITADYHNFLHVLHIYTDKSTRDHPRVAHKEMLLFANQAFDVMKSTFPWEPLVGWWTAVLNNMCRKVHTSEFQLLAPQFLQLSTKFGKLLLYHKQYQPAGDILQFADQCVSKDIYLVYSFATCQHPQADTYTSMLQALMKVHEKDGLVHRALRVRERLHHCVDSAPDKKPEELIPDDFCTVGITYLREKHSQRKDFNFTLQLFDAHFKCFGISDKEVNNWIKTLEDAYAYFQQYSHYQLRQAFGIARRCNMVGKFEKEAEWLMKIIEFVELKPVENNDHFLFAIHFRLTRLHWLVFDDAEKAVEHGKASYTLAVKYPREHTRICIASIRLADILHQIDGSQSEAGFYFEEALKQSPFLDWNQEAIYTYEKFAELHLISIHFHAGEHVQCIQHYGQWANLEAKRATRKIIDTLFSEPVCAHYTDVHSLAVMNSSLDWLLSDSSIAKRFLNAVVQKAQYSTMYYASLFFILMAIVLALTVCRVMYNSVKCDWLFIFICTVTQITHYYFLPHFCFHYFLYHALTKKQVWAPRQLPQFHPTIELMYVITIFLCTLCGALAIFCRLYLLTDQAAIVYSPFSLYDNISMLFYDDFFYDFLHQNKV